LSSAEGGDAAFHGRAFGINSNGVIGSCDNGQNARGVWGLSTSGRAGVFSGKVFVSGQINKAALAFQIDHPLDPENQYLLHSGVESPDMKNVYDGIAQLDEDGSAWIEMPGWFGEFNGDCRYQLIAIGGSAPDLHVAEEISENRFRIGGNSILPCTWVNKGKEKDRGTLPGGPPVASAYGKLGSFGLYRLGGGPLPYHADRSTRDPDVGPGEVVGVVALREPVTGVCGGPQPVAPRG
jgi:hypothetical protein